VSESASLPAGRRELLQTVDIFSQLWRGGGGGGGESLLVSQFCDSQNLANELQDDIAQWGEAFIQRLTLHAAHPNKQDLPLGSSQGGARHGRPPCAGDGLLC